MATKLRKLRITRVDRVWAPANGDADGPLARIVLAKAKTGPMANSNHDHSDIAPGERCTGCGYVQPMEKSDPGGSMPTETEAAEGLQKTDEADAPAPEPVAESTEAPEPAETAAPAEADTETTDDGEDGEDVDKALPESVRKRLEHAEAVAKAAEARVAKMEFEAEAKRWHEVAKGLPFVAVAKKVGGDAATDTGALLHSIAKAAGADAAGQLVAVLESAQARLAQSELLKAKGRDGAASPTGSASADLEKAAQEIRKENPALSGAQAYARAVEVNRELALKANEETWNA
jgi:hypothetical protein